jgi:hypothetical protein
MNKSIIGSKFEATRNLSAVQVAKLIRADIKALNLKGFKFSVKTSGSSMHSSIDISITAAPEGFVYRATEAEELLNRQTSKRFPWLTDAAREIQEKLEEIHASYNFDKSDTMTDYFHVRYYGNVSWNIRETKPKAPAAPVEAPLSTLSNSELDAKIRETLFNLRVVAAEISAHNGYFAGHA